MLCLTQLNVLCISLKYNGLKIKLLAFQIMKEVAGNANACNKLSSGFVGELCCHDSLSLIKWTYLPSFFAADFHVVFSCTQFE